MVFLDRTKEFTNIIQNKKLTIEEKKKVQPVQKSTFQHEASKISQDLTETTEILNKLIKLIKKKTPFDDNSASIQKLSVLVKEKLVKHNRDLSTLDSVVKENTSNTQIEKHSGGVVSSLYSRLYYAKEQFESVLKVRTKTIQKQQEREKTFHSIEQKSPSFQSSRLNPEQTQMTMERNFDDISVRTEAIRDIESSVHEISGMFQKLGELVVQQGELTQRISSNVSEALVNVEGGQAEIINWYQKISSNRGLILKLFLVLIIFIIFVAVFLL